MCFQHIFICKYIYILLSVVQVSNYIGATEPHLRVNHRTLHMPSWALCWGHLYPLTPIVIPNLPCSLMADWIEDSLPNDLYLHLVCVPVRLCQHPVVLVIAMRLYGSETCFFLLLLPCYYNTPIQCITHRKSRILNLICVIVKLAYTFMPVCHWL